MQILCATDFSKLAMEASDVAAAIAKKLNLPLCLMHCGQDWIVMGELPVVEPDDKAARERLASEAERLRVTGVEVTTESSCAVPLAQARLCGHSALRVNSKSCALPTPNRHNG